MHFKSCKAEFKANRETRIVEGYTSTFETPDRYDSYGDIIGRDAFDQTLVEEFRNGFVKVLFQHREPIGIPIHMETDSKGLYVKGRISKTQLGDETLTLVEDKVLDSLSIGFDPLEYTMLEDRTVDGDQVRQINKLKLYEWSVVTWGANPFAKITGVAKAFGGLHKGPFSASELESILSMMLRDLRESKAGRVLSQFNFDSLLKARDIIDQVLKSAQPEDDQKSHEAFLELRSEIGALTKALTAKH